MNTGYHKVNLKDKILQKAFELVDEKGYEWVSVRKIAVRLNISSTAIYRHYDNMEDLFNQIVRMADEVFSDFISRGLEGCVDTISAIEKAAYNFLKFSLEHSHLYDLMFRSEFAVIKSEEELMCEFENHGLKGFVNLLENLIVENNLNITTSNLFVLYWSYMLGYSQLVRFNGFIPNKVLIRNAITGLAFTYKKEVV